MISLKYTMLFNLNIFSLLIRLCLSIICGGIIGIQRSYKGIPAGFRTHMLVCLGATLSMVIGQFIYCMFENTDISRIGSQVISGIGFLGAGTILITGTNKVKGLTTAAGLWASACMGLAIGIGYYEAAILSCILIFIVSTIMHKVDKLIAHKTKHIILYIEFIDILYLSKYLRNLHTINITIKEFEIINKNNQDRISVITTLEYNNITDINTIQNYSNNFEGLYLIKLIK